MPAHAAVVVAQESLRQRQPVEDRAFLARAPVVLGAGAHLGLRAPVDDVRLLGAEADRHARGVHRRIACADHGGARRALHGRVVVREGVARCMRFTRVRYSFAE